MAHRRETYPWPTVRLPRICLCDGHGLCQKNLKKNLAYGAQFVYHGFRFDCANRGLQRQRKKSAVSTFLGSLCEMSTTTTATALSLRQLCDPAVLYRPHALAAATQYFHDNFQARLLYAVKTNPDPVILTDLYRAGVRSFDVASLTEAEDLSRRFPDATLFYMHPVKPRHAIAKAYRDFGVRHFSLDSEAELRKILEETGHAKDLSLHVRLAMPNSYSEITLANKFGVALHDAPALIGLVSQHAAEVGISFHVGSQCMNPDAYRIAIRMCRTVLDDLPTPPQYFNVGGGFPSIYPGLTPPDLHLYFDAIHEAFSHLPNHENMTLLAEPGFWCVWICGGGIPCISTMAPTAVCLMRGSLGLCFPRAFIARPCGCPRLNMRSGFTAPRVIPWMLCRAPSWCPMMCKRGITSKLVNWGRMAAPWPQSLMVSLRTLFCIRFRMIRCSVYIPLSPNRRNNCANPLRLQEKSGR